MALAKVLVVEDDGLSISLLSAALEGANLEVQSATSANEALTILNRFQPNVCLLDIDLGLGPTGIDLAHEIRDRLPQVGIVFLSSFFDPRLSRGGELPLPIGSRYIPKSSVNNQAKLIATLLSASIQPHKSSSKKLFRLPLSSHQIQVMRLVATGLTNAEIARQLGNSEKAVEHAISRILQKLEIVRDEKLNPRVQLVQAYANLSGKPAPR